MIHATVIGNLGRDGELKTTDNGKSVVNFSIATKGRNKDAEPTWVRVAMWGVRAEKLVEYLTKGSRVAAVGTLTTREYQGKTYIELDAAEIELLGGGQKDEPKTGSRQVAPSDDIPF